MQAEVDMQFAAFVQTGDPKALGRVFDLLAPDLLIVAAHLRGASEADDLVQTTFVRAIQLRGRFELGRPVRPWLMGILGRVAQEARNRAARRIDPDRLTLSEPTCPLERAEAQEIVEAVAEAVEGLPFHQRQAVQMRLVHGLAIDQIARLQAVPLGTAKARLRRGLAALRGRLPQSLGPAAGLVVPLSIDPLPVMRERVLEAAESALDTVPAAGLAVSSVPKPGLAVLGLGLAATALVIALVPWGQPSSPSSDIPRRDAAQQPPVATAAVSEHDRVDHPADRKLAKASFAAGVVGRSIPAVELQQSSFTDVHLADTFFGESVALLDDVDGDGCAEFAATTRERTFVYSGRTAMPLTVIEHTPGYDLRFVARAGDVDADGIGDLLVGKDGSLANGTGEVRVILGGSWAVAATFTEVTTDRIGLAFGSLLAGLGDLDGDGHDDLGLGTGHTVRIVSGRTLREVATVAGMRTEPLGDIDGDGAAEFIVQHHDRTEVRALGQSEPILEFRRRWIGKPGITSCAGVGDVDRDGVPDLMVNESYATVNGMKRAGLLTVYSGATGRVLRTIEGTADGQRLGRRVRRLGDVTGDGVAEVITTTTDGQALLFDLTTGAVVSVYRGLGTRFCSLAAGQDLTGDGAPDGVIGAPQNASGKAGFLRIVSGHKVTLRADRIVLSASAGGTQSLELAPGSDSANCSYLLLASTTGVRPGTWVHGVSLPLNSDSLSQAFTTGGLGRLDGDGRAQAKVTLRPGACAAALVGVTIDHAYIVFSKAGLLGASNSVPLTIVP